MAARLLAPPDLSAKIGPAHTADEESSFARAAIRRWIAPSSRFREGTKRRSTTLADLSEADATPADHLGVNAHGTGFDPLRGFYVWSSRAERPNA